MPFLQEDDYKLQIRDYELDEITGYTEAIRLQSELAAQAEMESYLRERYNVGEIFGETGDGRNHLIVMYLIDITLYHLFTAIAPRTVPQVRYDRYTAAINWLKNVAKGAISPDLPLNEDEEGNTTGNSIFGNTPLDGTNW